VHCYPSEKNYGFTHNYCDYFFDFNGPGTTQLMREQVAQDFIFNCSHFLRYRLNIECGLANIIAKSLFHRMTHDRLHYHTPVHILSIFLFAQFHKIELEDWERLAIWFHDAIYDIQSKNEMNESQSAAFMRAILPNGHDATNKTINHASNAILQTAYQDRSLEEVDEKYYKILDLDICNFCFPANGFKHASNALKAEYVPFMSVRAFTNVRRRFVDKMYKKKTFFRTNFFISRFESIVKSNLMLVTSEVV